MRCASHNIAHCPRFAAHRLMLQLKNKPHPRWAASGQSTADNDSTNSSAAEELGDSESSKAGAGASSPQPKSPGSFRMATPPSSTVMMDLPPYSSGSSAVGSPSPLNTPSPMPQSPVDLYLRSGTDAVASMLNSDYDLSSLLASYQSSGGVSVDDALFGDMLDPLAPHSPDGCANHRVDDHCGCLHDHTSYSTVLELSLRLRRATEILSRYAKHSTRSDCKVHKGISELDRFTT